MVNSNNRGLPGCDGHPFWMRKTEQSVVNVALGYPRQNLREGWRAALIAETKSRILSEDKGSWMKGDQKQF